MKSPITILGLFVLALSGVSAAPAASPAAAAAVQARCTNPLVRKEWRTLSDSEKDAYLAAVNCLHKLPAKLTNLAPGALTRFEDFIAEHKFQTPYIHLVGHFLPWHRLFMWQYEKTLRNECGYTGAQPYWDYTKDSNDISRAPVFTAQHGFGGNGQGAQQCVNDGAFAGWKINIAQSSDRSLKPRCLSRAFWGQLAQQWLTTAKYDEIKRQTTYGTMARTLEGEPNFTQVGMHGAGHFGLGGSNGEAYTSNSDPIFYLHHTNLDRIWWEWQHQNENTRLWDISGSIIPRDRAAFGGDYSQLPNRDVDLDFAMNLGTLGGDAAKVTIRQVMDVLGGSQDGKANQPGVLCYTYDTTK
ncbi:Di-copper centre-containing protein [Ascobolus immersus RN42]|uniref:Di-copper centre-containing protein n=1 Tax=Ascobolus immersus RN42 TaxID=1160509 RepID=A0A3N4IIL7_ASCIM|nr:Di-copper centre-containing protein [Ascobolus immersus RN42]